MYADVQHNIENGLPSGDHHFRYTVYRDRNAHGRQHKYFPPKKTMCIVCDVYANACQRQGNTHTNIGLEKAAAAAAVEATTGCGSPSHSRNLVGAAADATAAACSAPHLLMRSPCTENSSDRHMRKNNLRACAAAAAAWPVGRQHSVFAYACV